MFVSSVSCCWPLTIKLGHLFTQLHLPKDCLELGLVDTGDEPASHIGVRLTERGLKDLPETERKRRSGEDSDSNLWMLSYFKQRGEKLNLFVEPEHRAGHSDVSKADPLSHQEGTSVQVLIQHSKGPLHILLGLLCSLTRPAKKNENAAFHGLRHDEVPSLNRTEKHRAPDLLVELHDSESGEDPGTGWRDDF